MAFVVLVAPLHPPEGLELVILAGIALVALVYTSGLVVLAARLGIRIRHRHAVVDGRWPAPSIAGLAHGSGVVVSLDHARAVRANRPAGAERRQRARVPMTPAARRRRPFRVVPR